MTARKNAVSTKPEKLWRDAISRAVRRRAKGAGDPQALEKIADKVVQLALAGDMAAIKEIGDRLDGRPGQAIVGDVGAPPIQTIIRTIVDPGDRA